MSTSVILLDFLLRLSTETMLARYQKRCAEFVAEMRPLSRDDRLDRHRALWTWWEAHTAGVAREPDGGAWRRVLLEAGTPLGPDPVL